MVPSASSGKEGKATVGAGVLVMMEGRTRAFRRRGLSGRGVGGEVGWSSDCLTVVTADAAASWALEERAGLAGASGVHCLDESDALDDRRAAAMGMTGAE